jgi:hypothetical protein
MFFVNFIFFITVNGQTVRQNLTSVRFCAIVMIMKMYKNKKKKSKGKGKKKLGY